MMQFRQLLTQREDELNALRSLVSRVERAEHQLEQLNKENTRLQSIIHEWNVFYQNNMRSNENNAQRDYDVDDGRQEQRWSEDEEDFARNVSQRRE